jgi:hypothetical protein
MSGIGAGVRPFLYSAAGTARGADPYLAARLDTRYAENSWRDGRYHDCAFHATSNERSLRAVLAYDDPRIHDEVVRTLNACLKPKLRQHLRARRHRQSDAMEVSVAERGKKRVTQDMLQQTRWRMG